jgi:hypothetical protein
MKIVDLEDYRKKKAEIQEMAKHKKDLNVDEVLEFSAQQGEIVEALLNDIALLTGKHIDLQNQFKIVAAQAFLSLQLLQEKGVVMEEELHGRWEDLMKQVVPDEAKQKEPQRPPIPANLPGAYEPSDEDMGRILNGEDPDVVFAGKFELDD